MDQPSVIEESLIYRTEAWILVLLLLLFMLVFIYVGRKIGQKRTHLHESKSGILGTTLSAMFALLAFVLAFTFGMSAGRFDARMTDIVEEANAIGTAILRADLYEAEDRNGFRQDFQHYLEARIRYYDSKRDLNEAINAKRTADDEGKKLWDRATLLSHEEGYQVASMQMIPALNQMFDSSTTRIMGELIRVPDSIVYMLFMLSLTNAFYLGYSSAKKDKLDWLVAIGFCILSSLVVYITLDLDRPRRGIIQLSTSHKAMLELRKQF